MLDISVIALTIMRIGVIYGWGSLFTKVAAAHLQTFIPPFAFGEPRLAGQLKNFPIDKVITGLGAQLFPNLSLPLFPHVDGDGNCQDNATLFQFFREYSRAFEFRVLKGLHMVQNLE